ncbi:MAG: metal-dependent hydrolase [Alphaproteobacteria bacterium]|jgi:L-ascorbate metabolism protein UlaG (beta-lactamase superfamily)|nr:metal-dependent hydrolase [Alphaproteobacteria bacterium]
MASKITINNVDITFLGHSGFIIEENNHKIVIDPFLTGNPLATVKPESIKADSLIITHAHSDHIGDSISIAKNNNIPITATFELEKYIASNGAKANLVAIGSKQKLPFGNVVFRPAIHNNKPSDGIDIPLILPSSVLLQLQGLSIYHLGDTAINLDFKLIQEVYKPDVAIVPIGGHYTMDIEEAVFAVAWLGVKYVIPVHYNTFSLIKADPLELKEKMKQANLKAECIILDTAE